MRRTRLMSLFVLVATACGRASPPIPDAALLQDSSARLMIVEGLSGPEAVHFDSIGDVWFVANFNGAPAADSNGFISRVTAEGAMDSLRFMVGSALAPLHGPRGMYIQGDTLWVADAQGVHGFHRATGAHVAFIDFSAHEPGFLNDVAAGEDGALRVTDTGTLRVFQVAGRDITVAIASDRRLGNVNGITRDAAAGRFLLAGWGEGGRVVSWDPASGDVADVGTATTGRFDGLEVVDGRIIVASQTDSSLHQIAGGVETRIIRTPGAPADIGVDRRRGRVAVPYIALDRVDIWALPPAP